MNQSSFKVYNASAGSGKTYALSKAYLKIVLSAPRSFKRILAITFTNKAVNEMKSRILDSLYDFGTTTSVEDASPLFVDMMQLLDVTQSELQTRSKNSLKELLHNYAFFDISTIDKFTHRLIRTFAKDLNIAQNFEVVLDTKLLLEEAVARVIAKAGLDKELTKVLMSFALEKIDDDRSWDIAYDLTKIGALLFNENNVAHVGLLQEKDLADFKALKEHINKQLKSNKEKAVGIAASALVCMEQSGVDSSDFPRETLPNHFKKVKGGFFNASLLYNNKLQENINAGKILKAKLSFPDPSTLGVLSEHYNRLKTTIYSIGFLQNAYRNLVPLTLLNAIQQEVKKIQTERNQLSISEFNTIISKEITHQPAPFIYERLGEKYRHYFIDEFQDTSQMQWQNLIPLVANALESLDDEGKTGSLFLVGDAKQAIYRWRGGEAEQFLALATSQSNPFSIPSEAYVLPKNYRSHDEIVGFNNHFFQAISPFLEHPVYRLFYEEGNQQQTNQKPGGQVTISFLETAEDEAYAEKVIAYILESLSLGFTHKDICILIRKKKHGVLLANALMQEGIPVISSESLLLIASPIVQFLVSLVRYTMQPAETGLCYNVLHFLAKKEGDKHSFILHNLYQLENFLLTEYDFDVQKFKHDAIYDGLEYAVRKFDLVPESDAHLTSFMDTVFDVQQKYGADIQSFLNYWDKKGADLSISAPEHMNAVQIMTIHKSKGLEFPVVIFPYANTNIFEEIDPKLWVKVVPEAFAGFEELLLSKKQEVRDYGQLEAKLFDEEQQKLHLDAYNLLYVALTRAETALHIITKKDLAKNGAYKPNYYSGLFIHFLIAIGRWSPDELTYTFGAPTAPKHKKQAISVTQDIPFIYSSKDRASFSILTKKAALWDTAQETAMAKGNTIHHILNDVCYKTDVDKAILKAQQKGLIVGDEVQEIKGVLEQIVQHPSISKWYEPGTTVFNEKEIFLANGQIVRPDRIVVIGNSASVIDYKTGAKNPDYKYQLDAYANALQEMGFTITDRIIVYINDTVTTVSI